VTALPKLARSAAKVARELAQEHVQMADATKYAAQTMTDTPGPPAGAVDRSSNRQTVTREVPEASAS